MIKTVNLTDAAIIETHTIWNSTIQINKKYWEHEYWMLYNRKSICNDQWMLW